MAFRYHAPEMSAFAAMLGLIIAVPMVFVVAMTQVSSLQNTARTLALPGPIDSVFGPVTFIILLLTVPIIIGVIFAVMGLMGR